MPRLVLDTSTIIDVFDGLPASVQAVTDAGTRLVPVAVEAELWYGALNSDYAEAEKERVESFLAECEIVVADSAIARRAAAVRYELRCKGETVPRDDLFVAATALVLDVPLARA